MIELTGILVQVIPTLLPISIIGLVIFACWMIFYYLPATFNTNQNDNKNN